MHRGSIHQRHPKAPFKSKPCGFDCYTVLAPVSKCYPLLMGRLPTCYSPVRHSSFSGGASSGEKRDCYTVLAPVSKCYPLLMGRLPTCYSPVRHSSFSGGASSGGKRSVRLACIRPAASVRPEPGSNSHKKFEQSCDC